MPKLMASRQCHAVGSRSPSVLHRIAAILVHLLLCNPLAAKAMVANPSDLCAAAAQAASDRTGVPVAVLQAISMVETGRPSPDGAGLQPWPWAFNHAGEGYWFDTPDEAMQQAATLINDGVRNIDLGCFQLNLRWHSKAFSSLDAMLDPGQNALYAAEFLKTLYAKSGNWSEAAGAYHSLTPEFAQEYRVKFDETLASIDTAPPDQLRIDGPSVQNPDANSFPLLLAGARGNGGSLVPLSGRAQPLIGAP